MSTTALNLQVPQSLTPPLPLLLRRCHDSVAIVFASMPIEKAPLSTDCVTLAFYKSANTLCCDGRVDVCTQTRRKTTRLAFTLRGHHSNYHVTNQGTHCAALAASMFAHGRDERGPAPHSLCAATIQKANVLPRMLGARAPLRLALQSLCEATIKVPDIRRRFHLA